MEKLLKMVGDNITDDEKEAVINEDAELYFQLDDGFVRFYKEDGTLKFGVWFGEAKRVGGSIGDLL